MREHVVVVPLEREDAGHAHALLSHPEVAAWLQGVPWQLPDARIGALLDAQNPEMTHFFAAWRGGQLVGLAYMRIATRLRRRHVADVWVVVHPSARRQGIGATLLQRLTELADRWCNVVRLQAVFYAVPAASPERAEGVKSAAAPALLRRCGFSCEVVSPGVAMHAGLLLDRVMWGRLRPDTHLVTSAPVPNLVRGDPVVATLRHAALDDAAALAALHARESVLWGTLQVPSTSAGFWRNRMRHNDPNQHILTVAETDGRLIAMGALHRGVWPREPGTVTLGMAVHEDFQGRGVGACLLDGLLTLARDWWMPRRIELEVLVDNARAMSLYQRFGFGAEGVVQGDVWRDGALGSVAVMAMRS